MSRVAVNHHPAKAWLSEFLFTRALFKGPSGLPLYRYHVTEEEYAKIADGLAVWLRGMCSPQHEAYLAGCFCLFVSEHYRRHYDGSWSWNGAESRLGVCLTPQQHSGLTSKGLDYWKRPVRLREHGRDWLGTLFAEGGLPWPLLNSESHGFGKAIRRGIKHYYRTEGHRRTTSDLLADFEEELPLAFRNLETRTLLAGIVDQLMVLAESYPLKDETDPAAFLDNVAPQWHEAFPIPLDATNARHLLGEWLRDAGMKRQERKDALAKLKAFTCEHVLVGHLPNWSILTELNLPHEALLAIDPASLRSTRLELAYFEGEALLARGPAVYAQLADQGVKVRFSNVQVTLQRRRLDRPVSLRVMDNGNVVHTLFIDGSAVDYHDAPLVFGCQGERWHLVASSSCAVAGSAVRIRIPQYFTATPLTPAPLAVTLDAEGGQWIEAACDLVLAAESDHYSIRLNPAGEQEASLALVGVFALYDSAPSVAYLGWPGLELPDGYRYRRDELIEYANGRPLERRGALPYGAINYTVRSPAGETLLRRRFGVLPHGFSVGLLPALGSHPARIQLKGAEALELRVQSEALAVEACTEGFRLTVRGERCPDRFVLEAGSRNEPVHLRLPFPYQGAVLLRPDGSPATTQLLTLADLLGHRVSLSSGLPQGQMFHLAFELMCREQPHPKRAFGLRVGQTPMMLNLFSYLADLQNMLGAVDEQDAYIRMTIETEQPLLVLEIRRYDGQLRWDGSGAFCIRTMGRETILDGAHAEAMLLSDPRQAPLQLAEKTTESVGTGRFELPHAMHHAGPWLIYPANSSAVRFRPQLYMPANLSLPSESQVRSLHHAAQVFHPVQWPHVIDDQIGAMGTDFAHSGWQYLADLKRQYAHLPLSSFEAWKSLARHPQALAFAVFRLEADEAFCARIADELAVMWEAIPLPMWAHAHRLFSQGMTMAGLPSALVESLVNDRATVLRYIVSGFDYIGDYLNTGDCSQLKRLPAETVLPHWYQDLRRLHAANPEWPTVLGTLLAAWVDAQQLPRQVQAMSLVDYTDAVTYLPIFMAYVTAGRVAVSDLGIPVAYFKFAARWLADFDRPGWFNPVHAFTVSYLLASETQS